MTVALKAGELETVLVVEENDYQWAAVGVFRHRTTGKLYWAPDGGCSCNSAFETMADHEDSWEPLPETEAEFKEAVGALNPVEDADRIALLKAGGAA